MAEMINDKYVNEKTFTIIPPRAIITQVTERHEKKE